MDPVTTKAPLGGKSTGPNPTHRAKSGTKGSILVEGNGVPLAVTVAGANRHDMKLAGPAVWASQVQSLRLTILARLILTRFERQTAT